MGRIACLRTGEVRPLRHEHLVGRSRTCDLVVGERLASGVHAALRWVGGRWEVRDLGSRNGTFVDDGRVEGEREVRVGATVAFGAPGEAWRLVDGTAPRLFAERLDAGAERFVEGTPDLLALPSESDVVATVFRGDRGWVVEHDAALSVVDREVIEAGGRFRVHLPLPSAERTDAALPQADLDDVTLRIAVSRHEEHVDVEVIHRAGVVRLGGYAANELVLALARARLDDPGPERDRGWIDADALARMLRQTPSCVRQWIYLTRRRFEEVGISQGARIVERRGPEVRLGVGRVRIEPL